MRYQKWYGSLGRIAVFLVFVLLAVLVILPLVWMLLSSVKDNTSFLT